GVAKPVGRNVAPEVRWDPVRGAFDEVLDIAWCNTPAGESEEQGRALTGRASGLLGRGGTLLSLVGVDVLDDELGQGDAPYCACFARTAPIGDTVLPGEVATVGAGQFGHTWAGGDQDVQDRAVAAYQMLIGTRLASACGNRCVVPRAVGKQGGCLGER